MIGLNHVMCLLMTDLLGEHHTLIGLGKSGPT